MISYKLIVQNTADVKQPEQRVVVKPGEPNFKEVVFKRNLTQNRFKVGDRVKMRKTSTRGNVVEIITDMSLVTWVSNRPYFLVVQWVDGTCSMCIHTQLKPSKL